MNSFTHAGVSKLNGKFKVRYANDAVRVKVLAKNGHTDIDLVELKSPMVKEDAIAYLMSIDFANDNAEIQAALEAEVDKRSEKPAKAAAKEQKPNKEAKKPKKEAAPKKATVKAAPTADEQAAAIAVAKANIEATLATAEPALM
jgi:hypothetical protein